MRRKYICRTGMRHVNPCGQTEDPQFCQCGCEPDWTCEAWAEYAASVLDDNIATGIRRRRRDSRAD